MNTEEIIQAIKELPTTFIKWEYDGAVDDWGRDVLSDPYVKWADIENLLKQLNSNEESSS